MRVMPSLRQMFIIDLCYNRCSVIWECTCSIGGSDHFLVWVELGKLRRESM